MCSIFLEILLFWWLINVTLNELVQAVNTIVAGILHDVIDDTFETLHRIEEDFGTDVRNLVASVSKLSYINQVRFNFRKK